MKTEKAFNKSRLFLFILTLCLFDSIAIIPTSAADYEVAAYFWPNWHVGQS
jgi:hypothetical protein